jgi:molecular chaperone Hsp33
MGELTRVITSDGSAVAFAIDSADIVNTACGIHRPSAVVAAALGRMLTAASMMGSMLKGRGSVTLRIDGGGPAGTLIAVADSHGDVRGYVENPVVELALKPSGKLDVSGAVGTQGILSVVRDLGMKENYSGQVPLRSGEIAEDITEYFARSEQIPTACALGVLVDRDLSIKSAGGLIIQLLPFADEEITEKIENNISHLRPLSEMLAQGMTPADITAQALAGFETETVDERTVSYRCTCSRRRTEKILRSLGRDELEQMIETDGGAQVKCHFCGREYNFDAGELRAIADAKKQ